MEFIKPGMLQIYSEKGAINTLAGAKEAARIASPLNTSEYLQQEFFGTNPHTLHIETVGEREEVALHIPSAPYSEEALLVIAHDDKSFRSGQKEAQTIYDMSFPVQKEYWRAVYHGLLALNEISKEEGKDTYKIFATENCMKECTSEEQRTSRSIRIPHVQIIRVDQDLIQPDDTVIRHLQLEQRLLRPQRFFTQQLEQGMQTLSQGKSREALQDLHLRQNSPFGYSFTLRNDLSSDEIATFMNEHHYIYTKLSQQFQESVSERVKQRFIDQPSYRLFLYLGEDDNFSGIVSPEIASHAGAMEAIGVRLERGPHFPRTYSDESLSELRSRIKEKIFFKADNKQEAT